MARGDLYACGIRVPSRKGPSFVRDSREAGVSNFLFRIWIRRRAQLIRQSDLKIISCNNMSKYQRRMLLPKKWIE